MKKIFTLACALIMAVGAMAEAQLTIQIKKDNKTFIELGTLTNKGANMEAISGSTLGAFKYTANNLEPGTYKVFMGGTVSGNKITTQYEPTFTLTSAQTVHFYGHFNSSKNSVDGLCSALQYGVMDDGWQYYAMGSASYGNTTATGYFVTPVAKEMKLLKFGVATKVLAVDVLTSSSAVNDVNAVNAVGNLYTQTPGLKKFEFDYATRTVTYSDATTMDVKISAAGASTLCAPVVLTIPTGVRAYTLAYNSEEEVLEAEEVENTIPANTPVLLNANEDVYSFGVGAVAETIATAKTSTNKDYMLTVTSGALNGVYQEKYVPQNAYVLQNGEKGVGFYQVTDANAKYVIDAFRCYVNLSSASNARSLSIVFPETTGIEEVKTASAKSVKKMVDGRLVIEKNGNTFNAAGQIIK